MPLTRDRIIGHDNERLAFRFTMLNAADTVECQISDAAMDELAGTENRIAVARSDYNEAARQQTMAAEQTEAANARGDAKAWAAARIRTPVWRGSAGRRTIRVVERLFED